MYDLAAASPNRWFAEISTVAHTHALTQEQLDETLQEYCALYGDDVGRAQFEQEYNCSFNAAVLGAFYAREMATVRAQGRIKQFDPVAGPVHKAWDIGVKDDTSIWWFQVIDGVPHILDCYTNHGAGVDHYAQVCRDRGWQPGVDYVPHDAKVFEWGGKRTRLEAMVAEGLRPMLVPNAGKLDGINAARITLRTAVFHTRCEDPGVSALGALPARMGRRPQELQRQRSARLDDTFGGCLPLPVAELA
jgi:phage terminase large subunit